MTNPSKTSAGIEKVIMAMHSKLFLGQAPIAHYWNLILPYIRTLEKEHRDMREALEKIATPDTEGKARQEFAKSVLSTLKP